MPGGRGRRPASAGSAARRCGSDRRCCRCNRSRAGPGAAARPAAPWRASGPAGAPPTGSIEAMRPAWVVTAPEARRVARVAATGGAMRWRWMSHQGRTWRTNRALSAGAELGPQGLRVRPYGVDHRAPADRARPGAANLAADRTEQRQQRAAIVGRERQIAPRAWRARGRAAAGRGARWRGSAPRSPAR